MIEGWGHYDLASIEAIKDEGSGFLDSDRFVIKLEIRLKMPENEAGSLSVKGDRGIYTVHVFL